MSRQAEYRALMLLDTVPEGHSTFLCRDDRSMPHVRSGETVIIDTRDMLPRDGEMYVISFGTELRNQHLCIARRRPSRCTDAKPGEHVWYVEGVRNAFVRQAQERVAALDMSTDEIREMQMQLAVEGGGWSEGPYREDGISWAHLQCCLQGAVVGLYGATFEEPKRVVTEGRTNG